MGEALTKLKEQARKLKKEIFLLVEASKHPKAPFYVKLLSILIIAYAFSPVDLIPDFVPVLGYLDDIILIPFAIKFVLKLTPKDVLDECREKVRKSENVKKKNWTAGIVIILLWIAVLYWIFKLFFK